MALAHEGNRVLVVDNEPAVLLIVSAVLKNAGFAVETSLSGTDALAMIREQPGAMNLLLADVMMPGLDGLQLAEKVREVAPDLPILFMTGLRGIVPRDAPVIAKPFQPAVLVRTIRAMIRGRKGPGRATKDVRDTAAGAA